MSCEYFGAKILGILRQKMKYEDSKKTEEEKELKYELIGANLGGDLYIFHIILLVDKNAALSLIAQEM